MLLRHIPDLKKRITSFDKLRCLKNLSKMSLRISQKSSQLPIKLYILCFSYYQSIAEYSLANIENVK